MAIERDQHLEVITNFVYAALRRLRDEPHPSTIGDYRIESVESDAHGPNPYTLIMTVRTPHSETVRVVVRLEQAPA